MRRNFCQLAVALLAVASLSAGKVMAQQATSGTQAQPAVAFDYSVDHGTAFATDDGGVMDYNHADADPSWITKSPSATRAANNQPGTLPHNTTRPVSSTTATTVGHGGTPACDCATSNAPSCDASCGCATGCECKSDCGCQTNCGCDCDCGCKKCKHKCHPLLKCHECCPLECEDPEKCGIFDDCCCLKEKGLAVFGWVSGGILANADNPASRFNGPVTFSDRDSGQLNQLYLVGEKAIDADNCGWAWGGRVDVMYGNDYFFTTAAGLDGTRVGNVPRWGNNNFRYGTAMPQLYAEVAYDDLKVKLGHFYTILGYEVVPDVGNFFWSHAYTMQYGEPFTHTGVLASKPIGDNLTAYAGLTNGWDNFDGTSRINFLGGLTYANDDWGSLAYAIHTGDESAVAPGVGGFFANRTVMSLVWSRSFSSRLTYVLQSDYGTQDLSPFGIGINSAEWYGVNQYLFYKLNCCWSAGVRAEWFRDDDGYRVAGLRPGNPMGGGYAGDWYECTVGLNWKPNGNLIVRPEVRWDWYDGPNGALGTQPFDDNTKDEQFVYGIEAIYQF